jgi:hypothetical protein
MKKYTIFILILNYFFKKLIFFKKLLFYNFYFYYDLDFFKNINQLNKNYNFLNFFLFLKIFNLKQNSEDYNLYKYELMFRFPKFSIEISAKFLKYFNLNFSPKYTSFKRKIISQEYIFFRLPTIGGIGNYFSNIFKRSVYLIVGSFKYLPLNYTNSGYYIPFIIRVKNNNFIEDISKFIFIKKYIFLNNKIDFSLKKYNLYYVFFNQKPDINLSVLFFFLKNKKINFFEYSSYIKQYKIFLKKYKSYDFFKFN